MTQRWSDIKKAKLPQETLQGIRQRVEDEILEMNRRDLREMVGKTQAELAASADFNQSEASRVERRPPA